MGKDMRDIYTETLIDLASSNQNICILEADLMSATGTKPFKAAYPDRAFNVGVAEANLVGVAAGLSCEGKIPFAATFGTFASRRAFDQFFLSANYARLNVKLVGTDPGVTAQYNGGTHMPFEDVGMMRLIPDLTIIEPCDTVSCDKLIRLAAEHKGSMYIRLHRKGSQTIYDQNSEFKLGKGNVLKDGTDITLIASGFVMVAEALEAAEILEKQGVSSAVIDMHTIKPLDTDLVLSYAKKTKSIVTCENHQVMGGLGGAVSEFLSKELPTHIGMIGVQDKFGQVGTQDYLQKEYKLTAADIVKTAQDVLDKKSL